MMADSDTENEQFAENVMHELQAFQTKPKTNDQINSNQPNEVESANGVGHPDTEGRGDSAGKPPPTEGKAPTRIIKLSRPSTQFSSSRAQVSNSSETNATSTSAPSNVNGTASTALASAVSGTPAPGSRLAALQRPGSPFHKYLQRATSPALTAAAKLTKPAGVPSTNTTADSGHTDIDKDEQGNIKAQGINGERTENERIASESQADGAANQTQPRSSIIPPRIQSSALTSSVLLRRPQSPLHGSRGSQIPINKQVAGVATEHSESTDPNNPNSPKSPKSDGPASPGLNAAGSITSADRVAIRNKLRANSFRLKDLLTKRPYGKAKDDESETKDDTATATDRLSQLRSTSLDNSEVENKADKSRVSAILLRSRSRASGERPPPTLISARSLRTRSADKSDNEIKSSVIKETDVVESNNCAKNANLSEERNRTEGPDPESSPIVSLDKRRRERNSVQDKSFEENKGISENSVTIGATLLRSPKTRTPSSDESPVPSNKTFFPQDLDIPKESHNIPHENQNIPKESITGSNIPQNRVDREALDQNIVNSHEQETNAKVNQNFNNVSDHKSKAIQDLEKEKEANLVFNSETIGQPEQNVLNQNSHQPPNTERVYSNLVGSKSDEISSDSYRKDLKEIQDARKSAKESFLSQSMTSDSSSTPRWRDWKRQRSEPGTTITDSMKDTDKSEKRQLSVDDIKPSSEAIGAVDMSRSSPAMKRSMVVTDLDQAMIDRDQQKLSSMFKDGGQGDREEQQESRLKGTSSKDVESDLDALRGSSSRVSKIQEKMCKSQDEFPTSPTSPPGGKTETMYKPSVNMEDAVKWPQEMPGKLDFRKMEVFEGQMLLNWLTSSIDKSHYLRLVMTKHDISVIACQMCTCLIAAGVIKQLEGKDTETVFKPDCMYYWTHTQTHAPERPNQDVNKLPQMWPPNLNDEVEKPGLKYTEADHQAAMVTLRHEYKDEVEKIQNDHQGVLDKARQEYETRLQQAIERIAHLQKEVEKYRCLAGIEKLTKAALSDFTQQGYVCDVESGNETDNYFEVTRFRRKKNGTRGRKGRKRAFSDDKLEDEPAQKKRKSVMIPTIGLLALACCSQLCFGVVPQEQISMLRESLAHMSKLELSQWLLDWFWTHQRSDDQLCYLIGEWKVCLYAFIATIGMPLSTFYAVRQRFKSGQRKIQGPGAVPGKMCSTSQLTLSWILDFSYKFAEKMPEDGKLFLPSCLTKKSVYGIYKQEATDKGEKVISESHFYWIWRNCLRHISIPAESRMSKCTRCTELKAELSQTMDKDKRKEKMKERQEHLTEQSLERRKYYKHATKARRDPDKYLSLILDGMDQSKTEIPHTVYRSTLTSSMWKLRTHLVGVIAHGRGIYGFFDHFQYPHGSNLSIYVLLRVLYSLRDDLPDVLYLQMDNCSRENKNKFILGFLCLLVEIGIFIKVKLSFLIVGHTHEDIDQVFSRFSTWLRRHSAITIPKLRDGFVQCYTPTPQSFETVDVFNVAGWIEKHLTTITDHSKPHVFKITKDAEGKAIIQWKDLTTEKEWHPTTGTDRYLLKTRPSGEPSVLSSDTNRINLPQLRTDVIKFFNHYPCDAADKAWWTDFLDSLESDNGEINEALWLLPEIVESKNMSRQKAQTTTQKAAEVSRKDKRKTNTVQKIPYIADDLDHLKKLQSLCDLWDADAARIEAGLLSEETQSNGYSTPSSYDSQYTTPAVTPDCVSLDIPMNDITTTPNELRPGDSVPPPPPAPPVPEVVAPPPPPAPPPMNPVQRSASLKPVIKPRSPMKPLFWQRIQVHEVKTPKHKEYSDSILVWEHIREEDVNIEELDEMFSKTAMITSKRFSPNKQKAKAKEVAKIIIPKRSQTIGILLSSLRLEMSEIEDAILKFDTSQLSEEKLRQIYENRGSDDEVKKIREHMKKHPDIPLDKPDQFLYDLSLIPDYAERIFCFIFQQAFQESIAVIESKMTNLRMTCRNLMSSVNIRRILGLVLALGNYMNGGNKSRGQADGFGLDILPKLKDVKSKDNMSSLLHYTVHQYIKKFERNDAGTEKVSLPLPDPSDMSQAMGVNFDELGKELVRIQKDFEAAEERAAKVIKSATEHIYLQPFKDTMTAFFDRGRQEFQEQEDNLAEGKKIFQETVIFFCVKPKSGDKVVTPEYFFSLWTQFCQDFKSIWKREQQKLIKLRVKENELRVKRIQENLAKKPVRTRVRKAGGLKDRLAKQGLLDT